MSISELISKVEKSAKKRTPDERLNLLKEANIIDDNGIYDSRYFSSKTVKEDIQRNKLRK